MAFSNATLKVLLNSAQVQILYYTSAADSVATISASGYFDNALNYININTGDIIIIKGSDNQTIGMLTNTAGVITLSDIGANFSSHTHTLSQITDAGECAALDEDELAIAASQVSVVATGFAGELSATDDDLQKALDTLDDHTH